MNVSDLIKKAERFSPRVSTTRNDWKTLYPVYEQLLGRGATPKAAIEWMTEQNAIQPKDTSRAYQAFHKIHQRRARK